MLLILSLIAATVETDKSLVEWVASASGPTLMAVIIVGALRGWWIPGKTHDKITAEKDMAFEKAVAQYEDRVASVTLQRDNLFDIALRQTSATERLANAAQVAVGKESSV